MSYKTILIQTSGNIAIITLNRPDVYNALSTELLSELSSAVTAYENDRKIGAIVLTGGEKVFAAGADINELSTLDLPSAYNSEFITKEWKALQEHKKPMIAAVSGYAIGGGCELALLCDIVLCDKSAMFGQPEITIGVMPGAGGTQRLVRAVGKAKAMMMCLSGEFIDAQEAKEHHLVAKIIEENVIEEAKKLASKIASYSQPVAKMIKESIDIAYESFLKNGLEQEKKAFYSTLALEDHNIGIDAFINKTKPQFINK